MSRSRQQSKSPRPLSSKERGRLRIGVSGWRYGPWRGTFYPEDLVQRNELAYLSRQLNSVEINGSFYSLQTPTSYQRWFDETPDDFLFSVKGSRFITHLKRLNQIEVPLANFFASGLLKLNQKLGPILWQFPPNFIFDRDRLEKFFQILPRDTQAAASLAEKHDQRVKGQAWTTTDLKRPLRYALEFRHRTFTSDQSLQLLRDYNIAAVVADTAGKWPYLEEVTADLVYIRLHGDKELYVSGYTPEALDSWAEKIRRWQAAALPKAKLAPGSNRRKVGCDVFAYFDNDVKVRAPYDAMNLAHRLGIGPQSPEPPEVSTITETARTRWPGYTSRKASAKARRGAPRRPSPHRTQP